MWLSKTPDTEILSMTECTSIKSLIMTNQMRSAGHIVRMKNQRFPKSLFNGEPLSRYKPRKPDKDNINIF